MTAGDADVWCQEDFSLLGDKRRCTLLLESVGHAGGIAQRFEVIDQQREGIAFHSGDRIDGPDSP